MSFVRFLRWVRGTVSFRVEGKFAERFLNLLSRSGIPVFQTRYTKEGFVAQTTVKKYFAIRPFARKTHVRVRIVERRGLPFLLRRWKRRKGLLVGVAAFLLLLFLSGQFVWEIQINGNQTVTDDEILQSLEEMGLSRGSWKESLDVQKMAILLRQQYEQIGWAAINLVGGVAEVEINERQEGEEIVESNEPCNVVAARGGQIVRMEVYDGQRVRQDGETVKKGDLLVSGVVANSKNKTILRHAEAKVLAEYSQSHEVSVPLTQTLKVPQGGMENYRYLNIGPLRLPLFIVGAGEEESFSRAFTRPIRIFGITLPLDMTILQVIPAQQQVVELSQEKAEYFAMQQLEAFEKEVPEREVVSRKISKTVSDGELVLKADYVFREDIAQQEEILLDAKTQ